MSKTHTLWHSADKLCPFTLDFISALLHKNKLVLHEERGLTTRTFSLIPFPSAHATYTPDSDESRAREDERGEAYEGTHELGPLTRLFIHEAEELDRQRESAGLSFDEGEED